MEGNRKYRDFAILAVTVSLYIAAAWFIAHNAGPLPADPDYAYLTNGLSILTLKTPNFFDHPGTPVQEIIALVLGAAWLLTLPQHGFSSVQSEILAHPEFYLSCASWTFSLGVAVAMVFFASTVRTTDGRLTPAIIGIASIFCSSAAFLGFHRVTPEPVLLAGALGLAGLVARAAFAGDDFIESPRYAAAIGILLGFCVTAKVTSAPLLLTVFFLRSGPARKTAILACGASALVFLLPVVPHARVMLRSYFTILTHKGVYGSGASGTLSPAEFLANVLLLVKYVPEIFGCLALYLAVLIGAKALRRPLPGNFGRGLLLCAAIIVAGIILVAKQPQPYYLIPVTGFICLGNAIIASLFLRHVKYSRAVAGAVIALLAILAFRTQSRIALSAVDDWNSDQVFLNRATQSGCLIVPYYAVRSPVWSLSFGNDMAGDFYSSTLDGLYPDFVFYHTGRKQFETFKTALTPQAAAARFAHEKCVYLAGIPWHTAFGLPMSALRLVTESPRAGHALYALQRGWQRP